MKNNLLIITLFSIVLFNLGCKKPPTQPPDEKPTTCTYPAGNRNFTWRIDTVAWFPSSLGGVWALSDAYAYAYAYVMGTYQNNFVFPFNLLLRFEKNI